MAATAKQLANLKKAREARAKNLNKKAPAKKKKPVKRAVKSRNQKYILKVTLFDNRVGYLAGDGKFDTERKEAFGYSLGDAELTAKTIHDDFKRYIHKVEILKK